MDPYLSSCDVDPPKGRAQTAQMMAGLAFASVILAAVYYAFNVILTLIKGK